MFNSRKVCASCANFVLLCLKVSAACANFSVAIPTAWTMTRTHLLTTKISARRSRKQSSSCYFTTETLVMRKNSETIENANLASMNPNACNAHFCKKGIFSHDRRDHRVRSIFYRKFFTRRPLRLRGEFSSRRGTVPLPERGLSPFGCGYAAPGLRGEDYVTGNPEEPKS